MGERILYLLKIAAAMIIPFGFVSVIIFKITPVDDIISLMLLNMISTCVLKLYAAALI